MTEQSPLLAKLEAQKSALQKKINEARKAEAKKANAIKAKEHCAIGYAILAEMDANPSMKETIIPILDKHTKNVNDRKLLGLAPLAKTENK